MTGLNYEVITDEGFLNNPYRSVRYLDDSSARGFSFQPEVYPSTRTSNAVALNARYYLPYRAAIHGEYRFYTDTWGIDANTASLGYTHPWGKRWIFEAGYRWYDQSSADFYADLFPRANAQNFMARDKELSTFTSQMFSFGATYELPSLGWDRILRVHRQPVLRPHPVSLRRLPRHHCGRRAGDRGTLRFRRQRVPVVDFGLVLAANSGPAGRWQTDRRCRGHARRKPRALSSRVRGSPAIHGRHGSCRCARTAARRTGSQRKPPPPAHAHPGPVRARGCPRARTSLSTSPASSRSNGPLRIAWLASPPK